MTKSRASKAHVGKIFSLATACKDDYGLRPPLRTADHAPEKIFFCIVLPIACLIFGELSVPGGVVRRLFGTANDDPGVQIVEERRGNLTHIILTTRNCLDITITLAAEPHNVRVSPSLPVTVETRSRQRVEIVSFEPIEPAKTWAFPYTYHWLYGGRGSRPNRRRCAAGF